MELLGIETTKRLKRVTRRHPELGLRLAAHLGATLGPGTRWAPTDEDVATVLGTTNRWAIRRVQRRVAASILRDLALSSIVKRRNELDSVAQHVRVVGGERLRALHQSGSPVVVLIAHAGALHAGVFALELLGIPGRMVIQTERPLQLEHVQYARVTEAFSAARFLRTALRDLRRGIVPIVAMDAASTKSAAVSAFGRQLSVDRGPAALARAGAQLVPVMGRWIGRSARMEIRVYEPLAAVDVDPRDPTWEQAVLQGCTGWLERHLRENPDQMRPRGFGSLPFADDVENPRPDLP